MLKEVRKGGCVGRGEGRKRGGGAWRKEGGGRGIGVGLKLQKADKRNKDNVLIWGKKIS